MRIYLHSTFYMNVDYNQVYKNNCYYYNTIGEVTEIKINMMYYVNQ